MYFNKNIKILIVSFPNNLNFVYDSGAYNVEIYSINKLYYVIAVRIKKEAMQA